MLCDERHIGFGGRGLDQGINGQVGFFLVAVLFRLGQQRLQVQCRQLRQDQPLFQGFQNLMLRVRYPVVA